MMLRNLPVFVAIPTGGQSSAARVGARALRFVWHPVPPGHEKGPSRFREGPRSKVYPMSSTKLKKHL
jgi:hypothetical protein